MPQARSSPHSIAFDNRPLIHRSASPDGAAPALGGPEILLPALCLPPHSNDPRSFCLGCSGPLPARAPEPPAAFQGGIPRSCSLYPNPRSPPDFRSESSKPAAKRLARGQLSARRGNDPPRAREASAETVRHVQSPETHQFAVHPEESPACLVEPTSEAAIAAAAVVRCRCRSPGNNAPDCPRPVQPCPCACPEP